MLATECMYVWNMCDWNFKHGSIGIKNYRVNNYV